MIELGGEYFFFVFQLSLYLSFVSIKNIVESVIELRLEEYMYSSSSSKVGEKQKCVGGLDETFPITICKSHIMDLK